MKLLAAGNIQQSETDESEVEMGGNHFADVSIAFALS